MEALLSSPYALSQGCQSVSQSICNISRFDRGRTCFQVHMVADRSEELFYFVLESVLLAQAASELLYSLKLSILLLLPYKCQDYICMPPCPLTEVSSSWVVRLRTLLLAVSWLEVNSPSHMGLSNKATYFIKACKLRGQ
jgi:hypothetical protein